MSGMTLGGMLEADRRVRLLEDKVRLRNRAERDDKVWRKWGTLLEEEEVAKYEKKHPKKKEIKPSS